MDIWIVVRQIIVLFLLMGVGYAATLGKLIDDAGRKTLSSVVVNIGLSSLAIYSIMGGPQLDRSIVLGTVSLSILSYIPSAVLAFAVPKLTKTPIDRQGLYSFMLFFGNVGFMGYPVVRSIFGEEGIFYASLCGIPFYVLTYSLGIMLLKRSSKSDSKSNLLKTLATTLPFVCALGSVTFYLLGVGLPPMLRDTTKLLSDICTPISMMVIGSTLSTIAPKEILGDYRLLLMAFCRLLLAPALVLLALRQFNIDPLITGVITVITAMPVAANATMMCLEYGGDSRLAARGVFISTLLSVVTIPLVVAMLQHF